MKSTEEFFATLADLRAGEAAGEFRLENIIDSRPGTIWTFQVRYCHKYQQQQELL